MDLATKLTANRTKMGEVARDSQGKIIATNNILLDQRIDDAIAEA